jgi:CheY-like chemotaxis protein/serine phosphatase RsbU (regulator of sigma subunit)
VKSQLKVLVADDARQNVELLAKHLARMGHTPILAYNGVQAVQLFETEAPDLVLMDVMMPEMDGFEAAKRIKALCENRWVPVIFISALGQEASIVEGLETGGDDYLTKPINLAVLRAKIRAMQRIAGLLQLITDKADELERYYYRAKEEARVGSYIMDHIVNTPGLRDALFHYWISPAEDFSGDLVAAARTPGGVLHVMLADGAGHGLSAALNVLPLTQIFYSMTEKGFSLPTIVEELNHKINVLMPVDRFVSTVLAAIDTRENTIEIWNGGNPAPFFLNTAGEILCTWESRHLPIGILKRDQFDSRTDVFHWDEPGELYFCSDGLLEAQNPQGEQFGRERMTDTLSRTPQTARFPTMLNSLSGHLAGRSAHDDVSLIMVTIPRQNENTEVVESAHSPSDAVAAPAADQWQLKLSFGAKELSYLDAVPLIMHIVEQIESIKAHVNPLFLIISELFINALDHGLLGLESNIKHLPDGFEKYMDLKQARLSSLTQGRIHLGLEHTEKYGAPMLEIHIQDSGAGFNHPEHMNKDLGTVESAHGRGIGLVRSLCTKLEYVGNGNEVKAYYAL